MKNNNHNSSHSLLRGIKNFVSQDPMWKLFSLVVAVVLWFVVMNTINPTEIKTFTAAVSLENIDDLHERGFVVSNLKSFNDLTVSVKVEGTRPALDELSKTENRKNIKAKIDLSKLDINSSDTFPKTYSAVIVPSVPGSTYMYSYDIANYYPTVADIIIDKAGSKTVPVELKTYGSPASGYVAGKISSDISEVTVTGPESEIAKVEKVVATIDITNETSFVQKDCTMSVYDEDDTLLENFVVSPSSIPVSVEIKKSSTLKINEPSTKGALPEHLELLSIDWTPKSINVISDSKNVPESISLPPVDLSEINRETTITEDISSTLERLNVESEDNIKSVKITIKVGVKSAKEYTIPSSTIGITGLDPTLTASISDNVKIEVGGVDNLDVYSLSPVIDLTGLDEGKHTVPLKLNLPEKAALKEDVEVSVEITKKPEYTNSESQEIETSPPTESTTLQVVESTTETE